MWPLNTSYTNIWTKRVFRARWDRIIMTNLGRSRKIYNCVVDFIFFSCLSLRLILGPFVWALTMRLGLTDLKDEAEICHLISKQITEHSFIVLSVTQMFSIQI